MFFKKSFNTDKNWNVGQTQHCVLHLFNNSMFEAFHILCISCRAQIASTGTVSIGLDEAPWKLVCIFSLGAHLHRAQILCILHKHPDSKECHNKQWNADKFCWTKLFTLPTHKEWGKPSLYSFAFLCVLSSWHWPTEALIWFTNMTDMISFG